MTYHSMETLPIVAANDDEVRDACLAHHHLNGTALEPLFDQLAALAATMFDVAIVALSVADAQNQGFIGTYGLGLVALPQCMSLCNETLASAEPVIVPDLARDPLYQDNLFVRGPVSARFYAGTPLLSTDGNHIGALCLVDPRPRTTFSSADAAMLVHIADIASKALERRRVALIGLSAQRFVEVTAMAVVTADGTGRITFWNDAAERLFGYTAQEAVGRNLTLIIPARFHDAHCAGTARLLAGATPRLSGKSVEVQAIRRDGTEFPIELTLSYWKTGGNQSFGAHIQDISERRDREARLRHLAHHDELTGLLNRRGFIDHVERCAAGFGQATVLALDLDGFKAVNDAFGHGVGDAFLQALSLRLRAATDDGVALARVGGDEFAILLAEGADLLDATTTARAILTACTKSISIAQHHLHVGVSIGIAVAPVRAGNVEDLLVRADLALFRAKRDGGRAYCIFDTEMGEELAASRAIKVEIGRASVEREWELLYQPQVRLGDGTLTGAEALIRWNHPRRGLLAPAAFMALLERHATAFEVGCRVIDQACRQMVAWRAAGLGIAHIAVNLFAAQIRAGNLADIVTAALARHGLQPADLELEITETIALQHDRELDPLRALHDAGVAIAFDDFGTGFASLTTLKRFPLSRLKIDRSFVADLCVEPHSAAIAEGVIAIGHRLGLSVIAEGIETADQEAALVRLGCDDGQGYRYGRPMTGDQLVARFNRLPGTVAWPMFPV